MHVQAPSRLLLPITLLLRFTAWPGQCGSSTWWPGASSMAAGTVSLRCNLSGFQTTTSGPRSCIPLQLRGGGEPTQAPSWIPDLAEEPADSDEMWGSFCKYAQSRGMPGPPGDPSSLPKIRSAFFAQVEDRLVHTSHMHESHRAAAERFSRAGFQRSGTGKESACTTATHGKYSHVLSFSRPRRAGVIDNCVGPAFARLLYV